MKLTLKRITLFSLSLFIIIAFGLTMRDYGVSAQSKTEWNVMDKEFTDIEGWSVSSGGGDYPSSVIQNSESITIKNDRVLNDTDLGNYRYYFLVSPSNLAFPKEDDIIVEFDARVPNGYEHNQRNEISIRAAGEKGTEEQNESGRIIKIMFYSETEDDQAHIILKSKNKDEKIYVDVSEWQSYRFVISERDSSNNRQFSLFINNEKVAENLEAPAMKGKDLIRMGHDNGGTSNLEVKTMRVKANIEMITSVKTTVQMIDSNDKTMQLIVDGVGIESGIDYRLELVDKKGNIVDLFTPLEGRLDETKTINVDLPTNLPEGSYRYKITSGKKHEITTSGLFSKVEKIVNPNFPTFEFKDEPVSKEDHIYKSELNPKARPDEFNFPSIIDTHKTYIPKENGLVDENQVPYRYYLFYAPHNDPGGISMMMSQSLDGPWIEYVNNPFIENKWFNEDGSTIYSVPHVSSPDIIWNADEELFFLYFHGNNTQTRFATSPDLVNWTYGDIAVVAKDFSAIGNEASYARVYEYEVKDLDNKYVMFIMVNETNDIRRIHWAHSKDGRNWTAVKEPLAHPLNAPDGIDYSGKGYNGPGANTNMSGPNMSGPFFWKWQDRYYLICHGSNGDIMAIEVGENLDKEIHWGILYDSIYDEPDAGRAGAGYFIQDDFDTWHMFYEGGSRLKNNILHAVENSQHKVEVITNGPGTTNVSSRTVVNNGRLDLMIEADEKATLKEAKVNGKSIKKELKEGKYSLMKIQEDVVIEVQFERNIENKIPEFETLPKQIRVGDTFKANVKNIQNSSISNWSWDKNILSGEYNDGLEFTAIAPGLTLISYEDNEGNKITHEILILKRDESELPATGVRNIVPLGLGLLGLGIIVKRRKQ